MLYQIIKQMKTQDIKLKVEQVLLKAGNNPEDVREMMSNHFDFASGKYPTVKTIAECIRTIY